ADSAPPRVHSCRVVVSSCARILRIRNEATVLHGWQRFSLSRRNCERYDFLVVVQFPENRYEVFSTREIMDSILSRSLDLPTRSPAGTSSTSASVIPTSWSHKLWNLSLVSPVKSLSIAT